MFGLSFSGQLIQGSAERTWNCISQLANSVWYKFNNYRQPTMPRSRRKHHSSSRSRSHSHDKDRDAKRRKIEQFDSPNHKRSVSPPIDPKQEQEHHGSPTSSSKDASETGATTVLLDSTDGSEKASDVHMESEEGMNSNGVADSSCAGEMDVNDNSEGSPRVSTEIHSFENDVVGSSSTDKTSDQQSGSSKVSDAEMQSEIDSTSVSETNITPVTKKTADAYSKTHSEASKNSDANSESTPSSVKRLFDEKTPNRRLTPKQLEKKLESEKKRQQKEKEKEERERQKQLEKEQKEKEREERERQKQAEKEQKEAEKQKKKEMKLKEIEQKQKEKEEKEEQRRQEKELKLKQKEEERLRRQQEIDEKNKEKLREEEKKQKAAAAFVSFFVPKKGNDCEEKRPESTTSVFLPFEVKCDMKLPPPRREPLTCDEKRKLEDLIENNHSEYSYLSDLKSSDRPRSCPRTWIDRDNDDDVDVVVIEDEEVLGETICELKPKTEKMKVKLLQFHENQRPAYYGTWRKKSKSINGRKPLGKEDLFDYEVDSDDDWEEEEQGENLEVVSDDEKENEPENDDYEVDNEFFVPHGHLSDDEVDDEENARLSPESQKQKLKLLKDAFDSDIKSKTQKIKPRSIGCIWYNKDGNNVEEAIDKYLQPLNVITNRVIEIKKRDVASAANVKKKKKMPKPLPDNLMGALAKIVQGNVNKREKLVDEFLAHIKTNNVDLELSKTNISKQISLIAKWTYKVDGKTHCWVLNEDVAGKFNIDPKVSSIQSTSSDV